MLNVKPDIYALLVQYCTGASVSDDFPKEWKSFPKVTFTEENNAVAGWSDDREDYTRITYRIDVWDRVSASAVAAQVDAAMSSVGFMRTQCMDVPVVEDFKHKQLRYEAVIDIDGNYVFHETY